MVIVPVPNKRAHTVRQTLLFFLKLVRVCLRSQVEFIKLFLFDLARRVGEQALASLRFWEGDDVADVVGACQQHNHTVESQGDSAVGRSPVLERLEEEAES